MNIPQGYKQTELGIIPEDWEIKNFSEIFDMYPNNTYPRDYMNEDRGCLKNIHYGDILIKYPTVVDAENCHIPFLNEGVRNKSHKVLRSGDVIIADTAEDETVGKCIEIKNAENSSIVAGLHTFFCHPKEPFASGWLGYFINSNQYHCQLLPYITGIKVSSISRNSIQETYLFVPPIEEQRRIAEALNDVDALVAALDKKIAKKRLIKQGAMIQLLGGKGKKFRNQKIKDIVSIQKGDMLTFEQYIAGNIPVIAGGKSAAGYHNIANRPANTITISASGASAGYVAFHDYPIFATDCSTIKPSETYDIRYIYYLLSFNQSELYALQTGGAQPHVHPNDIYDLNIYYNSDIHTQQAIATILSDMDKEIADLEVRRDKYELIKSGMMQKLLTGQIRLVKPLASVIPLETPDAKIREIPLQTHVIAGHIVNSLYQSSGWGRTKLQKTLHLVGYHCQLDFGNEYIRNTAGPDDQAMMNHIDGKFKQYRHVKIEEKKEHGKTRYNYIPTAMIDELEQVYETYPKTIRNAVDSLINKVEKMDLARAEIVSTLYAVWNNRIIKGEQISDDLLLEDFYAWSKHKSDFNRDLVLRGLNYMRKEEIIPMGWGKYIDCKTY